MGIFTKPEVVILKGTSDAQAYLEKLELLQKKAEGTALEQIQKEIAITKAGIQGEENILFELKNSNMDMYVLQDIYLETGDGLGAQIDFIVVTAKLNFIIECKNLFGNIEIDSKGNFIRTMEYGGKKHREGIYSPITQNERHMAVLKECRAENRNFLMGAWIRKNFDFWNKSLVVLANPKTIVNDRFATKEVKNQVIRADQLIGTMKKLISENRELPSTKKEMKEIAEKILRRNKEQRKDYAEKYEKLAEQTEDISEANDSKAESMKAEETENIVSGVCPRCGRELVLRTAKKGDKAGMQFYGCSGFPKCRYVRNMTES